MASKRACSKLWRICAGLTLVGLAVGVTACGGSSSAGSGTSKPTSLAAVPKSGCGSIPPRKTADPDGVLAALPAQYKEAFAGIPEIRKSKWSNWKPNHAPPYNVEMVMGPVTTEYMAQLIKTLKARLEKDPSIGKVTLRTAGTSVDIPLQVQQLNAAIVTKPDLIVTVPLQPDALIPGINRATKAGIPVVTVQGAIDDPAAINVDANHYKVATETTARMALSLGGKGNVVLIHGFAGTTPDSERIKGAKAVLARCPGIKITGELYGAFNTAVSKSAMISFLATHPQPLSGIFTVGSMTVGANSALQQAGKSVPFATTVTAMKGDLGFWQQHQGKFHSAGTIQGGTPFGTAAALVALKTLKGEGPKVNMITNGFPLVTDENLKDLSDPSWTLKTPGFVDGPADSWMTDKFITGLFNKGQLTN